jgi:hypothetical protein
MEEDEDDDSDEDDDDVKLVLTGPANRVDLRSVYYEPYRSARDD